MRMLLAIVALAPAPAFAADYYVCERPDGTVVLTNRAEGVPQDCSARRTVAMPSVEAASEGIDPARWKAIDEMVDRARKRRTEEALAAADAAAKGRALRNHL